MGALRAKLGDSLTYQDPGIFNRTYTSQYLKDLNQIPAPMVKALQEKGVKWEVANEPITQMDGESMRQLQGRPAVGQTEAMTFDDVDAAYMAQINTVLMGRSAHGYRSLSYSPAIHETAHAAWDTLLSEPEKQHILAEHQRLYNQLTPYEQQGNPGSPYGANEMWAESVAAVLTGHANRLQKHLGPEWTNWVEEQVSSLSSTAGQLAADAEELVFGLPEEKAADVTAIFLRMKEEGTLPPIVTDVRELWAVGVDSALSGAAFDAELARLAAEHLGTEVLA